MEKEEKELFKKYPKILNRKNLPWKLECNKGWFKLIDNLCEYVQEQTDQNPHIYKGQTEATQIKEKFGGLRFYVNGTHSDFLAAIQYVEFLSYKICEFCGKDGKLQNNNGWYKTTCGKCPGFKKWDKRWG